MHHVGYRIRGFYRLAKLGHLWEMTPKDAQERLKILRFWDKHGLQATIDAFGVSRRMLYRWKKALKDAGGNPAALAAKSSAPKRRRRSQTDPRLTAEIRRLRHLYPNLGKEKLSVLLAPWCQEHGLRLPSVSTIGARAPDKRRFCPARIGPQPLRRYRQPKGGEDRPLQGLAVATSSKASRHTRAALQAVLDLLPAKPQVLLSDNGSEFEADFARTLDERSIARGHTYPKTPKMNAHIERFNRTLQESFVDYHEDLLFTDLARFNQKLADWLLFYNAQRPHHRLGQRTPLQFLLQHQPECQRWWTHTSTRIAMGLILLP